MYYYYHFISLSPLVTLIAAFRQIQISAKESKMSFKDYGKIIIIIINTVHVYM